MGSWRLAGSITVACRREKTGSTDAQSGTRVLQKAPLLGNQGSALRAPQAGHVSRSATGDPAPTRSRYILHTITETRSTAA